MHGLTQIFDYNRPFYLRTLAGVLIAVLVSPRVPTLVRIPLLLAAGAALFWICSSLLVSHYVYDRSPLHRVEWLPACLLHFPQSWINVHAGLDESSVRIRRLFPGSEGRILDIYDPRKMTEPSIRRARRTVALSSRQANADCLPVPDNTIDTAFLIFAAHELRRHGDRARLFREIARVLRSEGELVLIEHLRDWKNFLAFGPGFLHFLSKSAWQSAANAAGLPIRLHSTVTPFVHVFVLHKPR